MGDSPTMTGVKFFDPERTAKGERRASVSFTDLRTLWVNTGTLCNITCNHCYIESSPRNDRLAYFRLDDLVLYLDEIATNGWPTTEVGFTGGEPFMNPEIMAMLGTALDRGFRVLVLTNAMRPMRRHERALLALRQRVGGRLVIRVSLDHPTAARHDEERGAGGYAATLAGLKWLTGEGFAVHVAGRTLWGDPGSDLRAQYAALFAREGIAVDADNPEALVLFPEMDVAAEVPEITERCWGILGVSPDAMMCASARMVVRRRDAPSPTVVTCTLLPYDPQFDMGGSLAGSMRPVRLNHPHCAKFCVLGGGSCSHASS
jgi:uncharacterized Fe-S cluster-containing radical SAM superfamily protein